MASSCSCSRKYLITLLLVLSMYIQELKNCNAFQTFGFEMHHRYSDQVKSILGGDSLPEKGNLEYYAAMVHRDKVFRGRGLAETDDDDFKLLTFLGGNQTFHLASLGFLHYAFVSLGTPSLPFLVALDTGSDLFWVPCNCTSCVRNLRTISGDEISLNIYNSNSSLTSKDVPCNITFCQPKIGCTVLSSDQCPYQVEYLSKNTSSSGILVEDLLRLKTDNHKPKDIDARITFGCGQVQTGAFLDGGAPNGLFGLGMGKSSVPSLLSMEGLVADSFSMCFGSDGVGRISFGDKGSPDQEETPLNLWQQHPAYNISVAQISVGQNLSGVLDFSAIFDSGASVTQLKDPAYTAICQSFDTEAKHKRHSFDPRIPFEYCYDFSNATEFQPPDVTLIMQGGSLFNVFDPIARFTNGTTTTYCLAVVKSTDVNIIGQNFMTGYRIVFDREKMVLGWKASNCYEIVDHPNIPQIPKKSPPTKNIQPHFVHGGTPRNGLISRAPQFSAGKPQNIYLMAWSLFILFLPILRIV
ncbi:hypothetical protein MKW98_024570 [Papaver atlanticum]|uniref:Peptidase A1 domain-containing protein n=1 Tax=Papaver atlanticum TaxID=357466 RepID=A0AAD4S766_9MAGN|nr:hypothetical protein MKW98_024570 [Papaver atlanticum]